MLGAQQGVVNSIERLDCGRRRSAGFPTQCYVYCGAGVLSVKGAKNWTGTQISPGGRPFGFPL